MDESDAWDLEFIGKELQLDEEFRAHVARRKHFVGAREVLEVWAGMPVFFENLNADREHRAPIIMIGKTAKGRVLVVPIEPTERAGIWRAVTAYQASASERRLYEEEVDANGI